MVANFVYPRWNLIYPYVFANIDSYEKRYIEEVPKIDAQAAEIYSKKGIPAAIEFVTAYSQDTAAKLVKDWFAFFSTIFGRFRDVYITEKTPTGHSIKSPGYSELWRGKIVKDTGDRYLMPDGNNMKQQHVPKFLF